MTHRLRITELGARKARGEKIADLRKADTSIEDLTDLIV